MQGIVRIGDATTHNGRVISGSQTMVIDGKGVARKGDLISCPYHGINKIVEGDEGWTDDGAAVAFHGHRGACGCRLISSLPETGSD